LEAANLDMAGVLVQVQMTMSIASAVAGVGFLSIALMLRGAWGYADPLKVVLLAYAMVIVTSEAAALAMNPKVDPALCHDYNMHHGWTGFGIFTGWLQNVAGFLVICMQYWAYIVRRRSEGPPSRGFANGACMVLGSLILAIVPPFLTYPHTVNEVCSVVSPPIGELRVWPNSLWSSIVMTVMIVQAFYAMQVKLQRRRKQQQARGRGKEGVEHESDQGSGVSSEEVPNWTDCTPTRLAQALVFYHLLKVFTQVLNALQVQWGRHVMGGFAQMLVMECMLQHGQMLFLVVAATTDRSFCQLVGGILRQHFMPREQSRRQTVEMFQAYSVPVSCEIAAPPTMEPPTLRESGATDSELAEDTDGDNSDSDKSDAASP